MFEPKHNGRISTRVALEPFNQDEEDGLSETLKGPRAASQQPAAANFDAKQLLNFKYVNFQPCSNVNHCWPAEQKKSEFFLFILFMDISSMNKTNRLPSEWASYSKAIQE